MVILQSVVWNPRGFLIWFYFIWPLASDVLSAVNLIRYLSEKSHNISIGEPDRFVTYWWIVFGAMFGLIPWLRAIENFRFYVQLVLQTTMRTIPCFFLMFVFCMIWMATTEFQHQSDTNTFFMTTY